MDCESPTIYIRPLPHHHLPVVGTVARFHLRQPANDALTRLWLFRLFLHHPHARKSVDCDTVLHGTLQTYGSPHPGRFGLLAD